MGNVQCDNRQCGNVQCGTGLCGNVQCGNGQANLTGGNEADVRQIQKQGATIYAEPNGCAYFFPYNVLMHTQLLTWNYILICVHGTFNSVVEVDAKSQCRTKWLWLVLYLCTCVLIWVQFSFSRFRFLNPTHSSGSCLSPLSSRSKNTLNFDKSKQISYQLFNNVFFDNLLCDINRKSDVSVPAVGRRARTLWASKCPWLRYSGPYWAGLHLTHTVASTGRRLRCVRWSRVERGWWVGA